MDTLHALQGMGLTLPSPAYILGVLAFSLVGIVAYHQGKRSGHGLRKWLGVALMFYPYAVSQTWLLYVVGAALTVAAFALRDAT